MDEKYYYSAKMGRFYVDSARRSYEQSADGWPSDAVMVNGKDHAALFDGQAIGKRIVPDSNGYPVLAEPQPPAPELLAMMAENKKNQLMQDAGSAMAPLQDAIDLDMATEREKELLAQWKKYRVLLSRLDARKSPVSEWPEAPSQA